MKKTKNKIKKITKEKLLKELNMNTIDEGCSVEQVIQFCEIHKITYYILDFKYQLFETNKDKKYNSNLPTLVFVCANNHMYPIEDTEKRETIFKSYASIDGKLNKLHKLNKLQEESNKTIHTHHYATNIFETLSTVSNLDGAQKNITLQHGACNDIFYNEVRKGNVHNSNIKISHGNTIVGFDMNNITIEENQHYIDVLNIIQKLNENIVRENKNTSI